MTDQLLVSIIVPVLDEETAIAGLLNHLAVLHGNGELIVADGGSCDATRELAAGHHSQPLIVDASRGRASQMNAGAAVARSRRPADNGQTTAARRFDHARREQAHRRAEDEHRGQGGAHGSGHGGGGEHERTRLDPQKLDHVCGTGDHPCTQLALTALEKYVRRSSRVIDIGTGSGILSIASLRLGAKAAIGVDVDEAALSVARENSRDAEQLKNAALEILALEYRPGSQPRTPAEEATSTGIISKLTPNF